MLSGRELKLSACVNFRLPLDAVNSYADYTYNLGKLIFRPANPDLPTIDRKQEIKLIQIDQLQYVPHQRILNIRQIV